MALSSTVSRNDYVGNGAASVYAYSYRIFSNTDLRVTVRNPAGAETSLVLTTDYTVDGVGSASGGNITLVNASQAWLTAGNLTSGYALTIRRVRPITQATDIRNQGDFFPETHEDSFDHGVMIAQQQQDEIDRSILVPETIAPSAFSPTLPATVVSNPGASIIVNDTGTGLTIGAAGSLAIDRVFKRDTFANLKALAAASPTTPRFGFVTDGGMLALYYYTGDVTEGDGGWIFIGGAGTPPASGGPI